MKGREGVSVHRVMTTQRHRETWGRVDGPWQERSIEELGGTVLVDGRPP